jgi:mono/diheme cytochrome c family protein
MNTLVRQRGNTLLKTLSFSIGLILVFTLVANLLPQVEGEAPVEMEVDLGALTMESFVAMGEEIFKGKGTCTLCHNNMGRAPDLLVMNVVAVAKAHMQDQNYKGKATNDAEYLQESMLDPGVYVVKGFGKKGSNDTESPMPAVDKAPIQLSAVEIDAVIAFLQAKDGNDISVALPQVTAKDESKPETSPQAVAAANPEAALNKYSCTACHAVLNSQAPVGPDLNTVGSRLDREQIRQSILEPNAVIAKGYSPMMPTDYADKMSAGELEMIVTFLAQKIK